VVSNSWPAPSLEAPGRRQSDSAYDRLKQLIIRAELRPGAVIEEAAMMERLGVGRTPLREALQRLAQEDLIENVPRRGYFVTEITAADLYNVFEVRQHLEGLAARLAAKRARPVHLAEFEAMLVEARAGIADDNRDLDWNLGVDEWFHRIIGQATGNPYLVAAITRHYGLSVRTLYLSRVPITLVREEIENYENMHAALQAADPARAEAAMRQHLDFDPTAIFRNAGGTTRNREPAAAEAHGAGRRP
jgi:DNA-binding GntR family transcriptional regulator